MQASSILIPPQWNLLSPTHALSFRAFYTHDFSPGASLNKHPAAAPTSASGRGSLFLVLYHRSNWATGGGGGAIAKTKWKVRVPRLNASSSLNAPPAPQSSHPSALPGLLSAPHPSLEANLKRKGGESEAVRNYRQSPDPGRDR